MIYRLHEVEVVEVRSLTCDNSLKIIVVGYVQNLLWVGPKRWRVDCANTDGKITIITSAPCHAESHGNKHYEQTKILVLITAEVAQFSDTMTIDYTSRPVAANTI